MDSILREIIAEKPRFHVGETELQRSFSTNESILDKGFIKSLNDKEIFCYGIDGDALDFIYNSVDENSTTLEIGSGLSTFAFALKRCNHTTITPNKCEVESIREYGNRKQIDLDYVNFIIQASEIYLPNSSLMDLDFVLIDGKHAFPWPIVDWFFCADKLKQGGLLMIDDNEMASVSVLTNFLKEDNQRWDLIKSIHNRTLVFQKTTPSALNVAWHMQPYITNQMRKKALFNKIRQIFNLKRVA